MFDSIPTITLNPNGNLSPNPEHLELHASLTTPDSEDWIVVPIENTFLIIAMRERCLPSGRLATFWKSGWCERAAMLRLLRNLPKKHELGVLSVYVATDAQAMGTHTLLSELSDLCKRKSFNVLSVILPGTDTKQCIRCLDAGSLGSQDFESASFVVTTVN